MDQAKGYQAYVRSIETAPLLSLVSYETIHPISINTHMSLYKMLA